MTLWEVFCQPSSRRSSRAFSRWTFVEKGNSSNNRNISDESHNSYKVILVYNKSNNVHNSNNCNHGKFAVCQGLSGW